jgi:hypothetical protein
VPHQLARQRTDGALVSERPESTYALRRRKIRVVRLGATSAKVHTSYSPVNLNAKSPIVRIARVTAGCVLLPVGVALLVLPGPGIPLVVGGLMLLEGEFAVAGRARTKLETLARAGASWVQERATSAKRTP